MKNYLKGKNRKITIFGMEILQMANVFPSDRFPSTETFGLWLAKNVPSGSALLELGAGNGAIAIYLSKCLNADIVATDINITAVQNIGVNAQENGLSSKVEPLLSDVFDRVPRNKKYDLIYWNTPFMYTDDDNDCKSFYDTEYRSFEKFFSSVNEYLDTFGRAILGFGSIGNITLLSSLANRYGKILILRGSEKVDEPAGRFEYLILEVVDFDKLIRY